MDKERRRSSASSLDAEKLTRLRELKFFNHGGKLASKLLKGKAIVAAEESAASALSKVMARKKGGLEPLALQIDIETDAQWKLLLRREGLIVVEVYSSWSGPCTSMVNILKKVKVDANDDRLTLSTVNSDNIPDLAIFKNQSEPAWIFIGSGKPVKLMRGVNAAKIVATIKSEFQHELLCMEGKAKRNLISIWDEAKRKEKAETEAILLAVKKGASPIAEEKEKKVISEESEVNNTEPLLDETENEDTVNQMKCDANERLIRALEPFTVIAIQGFLLETGAVTEIKDSLVNDFRIVQERYIFLEEDGVRQLFGIPYEIQETYEEVEEIVPLEDPEKSDMEETADGDEKITLKDESINNNELVQEEGHNSTKHEQSPKVEGENEVNNEQENDDDLEHPKELEVELPKVSKTRMVPVLLPDELVGDTLLFVLESIEVLQLIEQQSQRPFPTADDFILSKVGPDNYEDAVENSPMSLHALYGRETYAVGVWCPKNYNDKCFVMLNFFPQFVTEMLMPPPKIYPKYMLAIFPALFANEIMDHLELVSSKKDLIAEGKMNIPAKLIDRILKSRGFQGEDLDAQKKSLAGFDMFAVSVDGRNSELLEALKSLEPLHMSIDNENGRFETAKLFPYLNILIDDDYEEDYLQRDLIVGKFLSGPKNRLEAIIDSDSNSNIEIEQVVVTTEDYENDNSYASQEPLPEVN